MSRRRVREASAVTAILMIGVTAIGCSEEQGPAEKAGEQIDEAAAELRDDAGEAAEESGDAIEEAGESVDDATGQ